jgi:hypothetical protein
MADLDLKAYIVLGVVMTVAAVLVMVDKVGQMIAGEIQ